MGEQPHTVLYIEDNEFNTVLMRRILPRRQDLRLITAALPGDGIEMARAQRPDLILLDVQMPGMNGFEVLQRLRRDDATSHIPVIAVSANAMNGADSEAAAAGFAAYLTKPVDLARLWAAPDRELGPNPRI